MELVEQGFTTFGVNNSLRNEFRANSFNKDYQKEERQKVVD